MCCIEAVLVLAIGNHMKQVRRPTDVAAWKLPLSCCRCCSDSQSGGAASLTRKARIGLTSTTVATESPDKSTALTCQLPVEPAVAHITVSVECASST
jgi:hypothetical protein